MHFGLQRSQIFHVEWVPQGPIDPLRFERIHFGHDHSWQLDADYLAVDLP